MFNSEPYCGLLSIALLQSSTYHFAVRLNTHKENEIYQYIKQRLWQEDEN